MKNVRKQYTTKTGKFGKEIYVEDPNLGGYTAFFEEFPNVIAEGETIKEAQTHLWYAICDILSHFLNKLKL